MYGVVKNSDYVPKNCQHKLGLMLTYTVYQTQIGTYFAFRVILKPQQHADSAEWFVLDGELLSSVLAKDSVRHTVIPQ